MEDKTSVIIVTWNVENCIENCLCSFAKYHTKNNYKIIVVDNASTDTTIEIVERLAKELPITLLKLKTNIGFGKANNIGINMADTEYVLLLNPDTISIQNILNDMISCLKENENVGIVAPELLNKDGSLQKSVANFPLPGLYLLNQLHAGRLFPNSIRRKYFQTDCCLNVNRYVDWAIAAAFFCRTKELKNIGGFNEIYYMYGEDIRLCQDYKWLLHKSTYYYRNVRLIHLGGQSEKQVVGKNKIYYGTWAILYFNKKFYGSVNMHRLKIDLYIENGIKLIISFLIEHYKDDSFWKNKRKNYLDTIKATKKAYKELKEMSNDEMI